MTANQLVAYNLRRAREERKLTQEQAAELLEPFLGRRWSKATFSAAETSTTSGRTREFSANEILAFASVFDVPVGWFFLPPPEDDDLRNGITTGGDQTIESTSLIDMVAPHENAAMLFRFIELKDAPPLSRHPDLGRQLAVWKAEVDALVNEALLKATTERLAQLATQAIANSPKKGD